MSTAAAGAMGRGVRIVSLVSVAHMMSHVFQPALFIKPVAFGRVARDAGRAVVSFVVGESSFSARSFYGGLGVQMR